MIQKMSIRSAGERFAVFTPNPSAEDIKLADALAEDAARRSLEAEKEHEYAQMAKDLINDAEDAAKRRELVRIAVWHYKRSAAGFRSAVVSFESAARIQNAERVCRRLLKKAEAMAESALKAELAVLELGRGEKTRIGGSNDETG